MATCSLLSMALLAGCSNDNTDGTQPEPNDGKNGLEFVVTIDDLTYNSLTLTITPPVDMPLYYARLYSDTEAQLGVSDEDLLYSILEDESFENFLYTDTQTFNYGGLIGHSHYRLIYFSYSELFEQVTGSLYRSDRITTPDSPEEFSIEVENVSGLAADFTITPPDQSLTYYYWLIPYSDYVTQYEESDNRLHQYDFAYWLFNSGTYEVPLEEIIAIDLTSGTTAISSDAICYLLHWDTEYMIYTYGLEASGEITVPMTKKRFKTSKPVASDNTFEVVVEEPVWVEERTETTAFVGYEVNAVITPKNLDEKFFVTITNKDWYDYLVEVSQMTPQQIMYEILMNTQRGSAEILDQMTQQGQTTFNPRYERNLMLKENKEYAVFIFGIGDDGPTTDLFVHPFTTKPRPKN